MSDVCAFCTTIKNQILKNFSKEMVRLYSPSKYQISSKVFKGVSPQILKKIFQSRDAMPCQLRKQTDFKIPSVHSVFNSTESIKFLGPQEIFTS